MKTQLIVAACLVAGMFLAYSASTVAHSSTMLGMPGADADAQRGGTPTGGGRQGGGAGGAPPLGPVNALGQEVRRRPAPSGRCRI